MAGPSASSGPSRRSGSWEPLPHIYSGLVVHPFHPAQSLPASPTTTIRSTKNRFSWAGSRADDSFSTTRGNPHEVTLDVGDEFFAFEEYRALDDAGDSSVWYRGYIVQGVSLPMLMPSPDAPTVFPKAEPSVLIGIFPAAAVHVRPNAVTESDVLTAAHERARELAEDRAHDLRREMAAVREEDEDEIEGRTNGVSSEGSDAAGRSNGSASLLKRNRRPASLILAKPREKEQPPLPTLTAGDSTVAGQQWPLVDEIACAIREWYARLPTYLAMREYRLLNNVVQHIDALFLGRRQLLSQMLSGDELVRIRRECVSRLVKCNVAQGLEVIVRSLEDGSVVGVDKDRALTSSGWMGGVLAYVYQVQLAYIDLVPLDALFGKSTIPRPLAIKAPVTTALEAAREADTSPSGYHLLLDFRAFVASPCSPGETAELFFSLYSKGQGKFLTEEFCLILNHNGSPARDAEHRLGKLRTLFADLRADDVASGTYLVCRIVRNGSMKMAAESSTAGSPEGGRWSTSGKRTSTMFNNSEPGGKWRSSMSISDNRPEDSSASLTGYEPQRTQTIDTIVSQSTTTSSRGTLRRPLGCAVFELPQMSRLTGDGANDDHAMPIYVARDEGTFATLHADIILHNERAYDRSPRAEAMAFGLRLFHGPLETVIREHPSLLLETPQTARLGFPDVVPPGIVRNDLYIKLWAASFSTLFPAAGTLRVRKTVAPIASSTQVSLEVRRADGSLVADSLYAGGSGEPPTAQYNSIVYYHNDRPTFGELIKIALPQGSGDCHLFLSFRHRTRERDSANGEGGEKPFGFAYLPLFSHNASIKDGKHELILYHMEKSSQQPTPNLYFKVPSTGEPRLSAESSRAMSALRDRISIRTFLCSTLHTQDDTLRALFSWQSSDAEALCQTLQMFGFVGEDEIAKFLQPVLDALFAILVGHLGDRREEVDDLVFKGLIKVLSMAFDRRFPSFSPTLASYTSKHFGFASSAPHLLRAMKAVMGRPATQEYRSLLKVWHNVFRFVIRSRELDRSRGSSLGPSSAQIEADFKRQTREILEEINNIMISSDRALIGSQTLAVQHYADILPDLAQVFPPGEIAEMVIVFTDTLTTAQGNLAIYKLLLILQIVKTLLDFSETRAELIPAIIRWIKPHVGRYEEDLYSARNETQATKDSRQIRWLECNRLAISIMAWTVNKLQELLDSPIIKSDPQLLSQEEDNIEYCLSILPLLFDSYLELNSDATLALLERHRSSPTVWKSTPDVFPNSHPFALVSDLPPPSLLDQEEGLPPAGIFKCALAETSVVIFTLVIASPRINVVRWLDELLDMSDVEQVTSILKRSFTVFDSVINFDAFPRQWLTLSGLAFTAVVRWVDPVLEHLTREEYVPPIEDMERFDVDLWTRLIGLLCDMCGSEELSLEDQGLQRRRAGWIIAGDLRDDGAVLLQRLWNTMGWQSLGPKGSPRYGGYQTRFTGLAERILTLCLTSHDRLCEVAVEILFSMIYAEYVLDGKFHAIQTEIFQKLELLFTQKSISASESGTRAYFVTRLRNVFEATPEIDSNFRDHVGPFLDQVELFIDLLMAVRDLPETAQWKEERVAATVRLMEFFSKVGRDDLYIRFVHHLVTINAEAGDWLGAGLALKLHADLHEWRMEGELVDEFNHHGLRLPAQTQFERKEALLYHVLEYLAEAEAYEYSAEICQELVTQHRQVTFNIERISELLSHEARLWESMGSSTRPKPEYFRVAYYGNFTTINLDKEFIVRGAPWQRYVDFCEALQVKHPDAQVYKSKIPPSDTVRYGTEPVVWVTSVTPVPDLTKPVFRNGVEPTVQTYYKTSAVNQFETMRPYIVDPEEREPILQWLEKTTLTTSSELPALQSRAEVVHIHHHHISPVDTAILAVRKAERDLSKLTDAENVDVKMLGTALNGAVDSRVNGGVPLYKKHFLDPAYVERHPTEAKNVATLREAVIDYVRTIQKGLSAHQRVNKDIAFHEALRTLYNKAYADEILRLPRLSDASSSPPRLSTSVATHESKPDSSRPPSALSTEPQSKRTSRSSYILPTLRVGPRNSALPEVRQSVASSHGATSSQGDTPKAGGILLSPRASMSGSAISRNLSVKANGNGHMARRSVASVAPSVAPSTAANDEASPATAKADKFSRSGSIASGIGRPSESGTRPEVPSSATSSVGAASAAPAAVRVSTSTRESISSGASAGVASVDSKASRDTDGASVASKRDTLKRFGSLLRR